MNGTMIRLSIMMFFEYVVWGSWLPLANNYFSALEFSESEISWIMNAFPIASLFTIMIGGQIADRYLAGEKVLAICHLLGGVSMILLPYASGFTGVFCLMLAHCIFYAPTQAVTNAISFANLKDRAAGFGRIRLWGTIGWIAASVPMLLTLGAKTKVGDLSIIFTMSGIAALILAGFSLFLPHTPPYRDPQTASGDSNTVGKAFSLLQQPVILVLFLTTIMDMVVHTGYFFFTGRFLSYLGMPDNWIMPAMSVGQIAEIGTMAILGMCLKRLGWRTTMTLGILGHAVRFFVFWNCDQSLLPLVVAINVVHGICYAFFFATVFIFIDEFFPKDIRNSAQGLFNLAVLGIGQLIGNVVWGQVGEYYTVDKKLNFSGVFMVATILSLATAIFFFLFFHPKNAPMQNEDALVPDE
jgi:nucleoside transporter